MSDLTRVVTSSKSLFIALALAIATPNVVSCKKEEAKDEKKEDKASKDDEEKEGKKKKKEDKDDEGGDDEGKKKKKKKKDDEGGDDEGGKKKKKGGGGGACADKFDDLPGHDKDDDISCKCSEDHIGGAVWGTDIYTTDSSPCAAAVHAGVITKSGGDITVKAAKGCEAHSGSVKNGITSGGWGSYEGSFYFPDKGDGKCKKTETCPGAFKDIPNLTEETEISCKCDATATTAGSVWGTDIYTQDSSLCKAALHNGAITSTGGTISAKAAPGCKSYQGTTANGATSSSWGEYGTSFYFPSKGDGVCKAPKVVTNATFKVGDAVDVLWNGSWWQATVTAVAFGPKYHVHYVGYSNTYDEWAVASRVRARTATSLKGSGTTTAPTTTVAPKDTAPTTAGAWKIGDAVDVLWNGSWWKATVIAAQPNSWKVHYVGYGNNWDEWVGPSRIRARTAGSKSG